MKKSFLWNCALWAMVALSAGMTISCDDDNEPQDLPGKEEEQLPTTLQAPNLVQNEEVLENPITLVFSWTESDHATEYSYQLTKTDDQQPTAQGTTDDLHVQFTYSRDVDLLYDTEYTFTVQAHAADVQSEPVSATVRTSEPPIKLTLEDMTYRSVHMVSEATDKNMLFQAANILLEKYTQYDSDMEFIENYDYGYYKAYAMSVAGFEWYQVMEALSYKDKHEKTTKLLLPETDYIFYGYGVEFDHSSTTDPVHIVTPLVKIIYTTPAWEATSDCTFQIELLGQEIVEMDGQPYVSPTIRVTPSDDNIRYYVGIYSESTLASYKDIYDLAFNSILSDEQFEEITDWKSSSLLNSGTKTLTGYGLRYVMNPGEPCFILVFGLNNDGLVTTEIERLDFNAISVTDASRIEKKSNILPRTVKREAKLLPDNYVERW